MYESTLTSPHINTGSSTFHYDLVDLGHLCLSNLFSELHTMWGLAYSEWVKKKEVSWETTFSSLGDQMMNIINDLDDLLSSDINYLLGSWTEDARSSVSSNTSKVLYEFNARNQVTLWGYRDVGLSDYAAKAWGGLVKDYYLPRWQLFISTVEKAVETGKEVDLDSYRQARSELEEAWNMKVLEELHTHTHVRTHVQVNTHTRMHTCTSKHTHTRMHTCTSKHTHTRMHTCTSKHTHTHTHAHMYK